MQQISPFLRSLPRQVQLSFALLGLSLFDGSSAFAANDWIESAPVIQMGNSHSPYILWNDPTVLEENDSYRMWLSGGDARYLSRIVVSVYEAKSLDGKTWNIGSHPVIEPSPNPEDWDGLRVETPTVTRVGTTYHLYYTGFNDQTAASGISSIGHATSPDGINWVKDPRNPVLQGQTTDRFAWAYSGVGEPGVVYNPRTALFHLYYAGMRFSRSNSTIGNIGILLATSTDGSRFAPVNDATGERRLILTRDVPSAWNGAWFGYSTPAAYISKDGTFHLLLSFLVVPGGPSTSRHVTLDHAESPDGLTFSVIEQAMVQAGGRDWKDGQVRGPTMVESGGQLKIWFAGERMDPFGAGIGFMTKLVPAP